MQDAVVTSSAQSPRSPARRSAMPRSGNQLGAPFRDHIRAARRTERYVYIFAQPQCGNRFVGDGQPELADDPRFKTPRRGGRSGAMNGIVTDWTSSATNTR